MAKVVFTRNIQRHVQCQETHARGATVREVLDSVFADNPAARGYILDDQAGLRKHITVFVDKTMVRDRIKLSDPVPQNGTIFVFQALSGG